MKKIIFIFLILNTSNIYSQQTDKYKKLISGLKPIDSTQILEKNNRGDLKTKGQNIVYECNGKYYSFLKGKYLEYYNNGNVNQVHIYDKIGSLIYVKKNNRKGQVQSELIATKISCKTDNLCDLLSEYDNLTIHLIQNYYKYSKKLDSIYKSKTVYLIDGEKIKTEKLVEQK